LYRTSLSIPTQKHLSLTNKQSEIYNLKYPFSSLSLRPNQDWVEKSGLLSISQPIASAPQLATLQIPSFTDSEELIPVKVEYQKLGSFLNLRLTPITPIIFTGKRQINQMLLQNNFLPIPDEWLYS
jgi:hypothetical protein